MSWHRARRWDWDRRIPRPAKSAVGEFRLALPDFYNIAVGIADVAARLAVFVFRLGDERGAAAFPLRIVNLNLRDADIHEAAHLIGVGRNAEYHRRLVRRRTAARIDDQPGVGDLQIAGRALAVAAADNAAAE